MTIQNYLYFFPLKPCTKQNLSAFNLLQLHWGDVRLQFIYLFEDLNPPHQSPPRKPIRLLMSRLELAKTGTEHPITSHFKATAKRSVCRGFQQGATFMLGSLERN